MRGACPGPSSSSRFPGGELQSSVPAAELHTQGAAAARCCNRRVSLAMWLHFVPLPPPPPPHHHHHLRPLLWAVAAPAARSRPAAARWSASERRASAGEFERGRARSCCRGSCGGGGAGGRRPLCLPERVSLCACVCVRVRPAAPHTCVTDRAESQLHSGSAPPSARRSQSAPGLFRRNNKTCQSPRRQRNEWKGRMKKKKKKKGEKGRGRGGGGGGEWRGRRQSGGQRRPRRPPGRWGEAGARAPAAVIGRRWRPLGRRSPRSSPGHQLRNLAARGRPGRVHPPPPGTDPLRPGGGVRQSPSRVPGRCRGPAGPGRWRWGEVRTRGRTSPQRLRPGPAAAGSSPLSSGACGLVLPPRPRTPVLRAGRHSSSRAGGRGGEGCEGTCPARPSGGGAASKRRVFKRSPGEAVGQPCWGTRARMRPAVMSALWRFKGVKLPQLAGS